MNVHFLIVVLASLFGYEIDNSKGTCHGFIMRWLEACMLNQEGIFETRVNKIIELSIVAQIENIKEKIIKKSKLNKNEISFFNKFLKLSQIDLAEKKLVKRAIKLKLTNSETTMFLSFLSRILQPVQSIIKIIQEIKEKIKRKEALKLGNDLQDILSFYESMSIYQFPNQHKSLFNATYDQYNIEIISTLASSKEIQDHGNLTKVYSEPGIYTETELQTYLAELGETIEKSSSTESIGILLSGVSHAIGLTYTVKEGWRFKDINQYRLKKLQEVNPCPAIKSSPESLQQIVKKIISGFNSSSFSYTTFNTTVITTGNNMQKEQLINCMANLKNGHVITKELALREEQVGLAFIAAKNNHVYVIAELAKYEANLNTPNKNKATPIWIAAQNGHVHVITELIKHKANFNTPNINGATPAWVAAQNDHAHVIAELAKHRANLNTPNRDGATPAWVAAQEGNTHAIAELAKHNVDFNIQDIHGVTPAWVAAQNGHAHVIAELAKYNVNFAIPDNEGITPIGIAVEFNQIEVVRRLLQYQVNPNVTDNDHQTLLHVAVNNGNVEMIKLLIEHGVNLIADRQLETPLFVAVKRGHQEALKELLKSHNIVSAWNSLNNIGMTPLMQAVSDGNLEMVITLLKKGEELKLINKNLLTNLIELEKNPSKVKKMLITYRNNLFPEQIIQQAIFYQTSNASPILDSKSYQEKVKLYKHSRNNQGAKRKRCEEQSIFFGSSQNLKEKEVHKIEAPPLAKKQKTTN